VDSLLETKARLRRQALAHRDALAAPVRATHSEAIVRLLLAFAPYRQAERLGVYLPIRSEVDTRGLIAAALAEGKQVAAPVTRWEERALDFRYLGGDRDLVPGRGGIPEPGPHCPAADLAGLDLVLVPGVVFDRRGYRLGYGAGLYDRALAAAPAVPRVGLAFSVQVVARIPPGPGDLPVDWLVTEAGFLDCRGRREAELGQAG